ncbi:MAG: YfhO family protein [Candidatus Gottesmanbacteria bacterium]
MRPFLTKYWPLIFILLVNIIFFKSWLLDKKLPIPADTIVGMYHPWRDFYRQEYPNGIPFKNFLITDPVRQQYVWRKQVIELLQDRQLPLWNPYNFSGMPLLANFQSASFYPLNILFFLLPFNSAWSFLVFLQPLLAGIFLYLYLKNLHLNQWSSLFGSIIFSFGGFSIAWLEWNTILHVGLWLPLIMLSIDKIINNSKKIEKEKPQLLLKNRNMARWSFIFVLSLCSSFFAGHLQVFFYIASFSLIYLLAKWWYYGHNRRILSIFVICYLLFVVITSIQWLPTWQLINFSARDFNQMNWQQVGWFVPWQNLIQFIAPDFFGNPTTLNYWGEWNYGEFIGYIGIIPLIFTLPILIWKRNKNILFFGGILIISLSLVLPTPIAKIPYLLQIPLLSTSQPTRLLFLIDFLLSILAALGLEQLINEIDNPNQIKKLIKTCLLLGFFFGGLWLLILFGQKWVNISLENIMIAKRNLILPTILFIGSAIFFICLLFVRVKQKYTTIICIVILIITVFDLFRFGWKFTPFTKENWLFPQTKITQFLLNQTKPYRIMAIDSRIFPPNFASFYQLEDVSGYDPLYLKAYGQLVSSWNSGKPDFSPVSFNRILTPQNYDSRITDLLNIKYILSLKNESSVKLKLVYTEGETRIYENINAFPRAFLTFDYINADSDNQALQMLFNKNINLRKTAIITHAQGIKLDGEDNQSKIRIIEYKPQEITFATTTAKPAILVLSQIYYPGWQVKIDGIKDKLGLLKVNYALSGIFIPSGNHQINIYSLL